MTTLRDIANVMVAAALVAAGASCKREERGFKVQPPDAAATEAVVLSDLHAGSLQAMSTTQSSSTQPTTGPAARPPTGIAPAMQASDASVKNGYEENAYAMSEGQRLYNAYNCVGCHFHGGGGIGPPLMDDKWIYGGKPAQIFKTIVEGRPNGMPSYRGKIVDYQVWQIAAYVRSMSGNANPQAAPGRSDQMWGPTPPSSTPKQPPVDSGVPKSAERPG
jgi:cytochrome c oxidase cbb3-type subunit 3